eukprot:21786_1
MVHPLSLLWLSLSIIISNTISIDYNPHDDKVEWLYPLDEKAILWTKAGLKAHPTHDPTRNPTNKPTIQPTNNPTLNPTSNPTIHPTNNPTTKPTTNPTLIPTAKPTNDPTFNPTLPPTRDPTNKPTKKPTTRRPTRSPTTRKPTQHPTLKPTKNPTANPTLRPTKSPTTHPTLKPTTNQTTRAPTTRKPTQYPSKTNKSGSELPCGHGARIQSSVQSVTISLYLDPESKLDSESETNFQTQLIHQNRSLVIVPRLSDLNITSGCKTVKSYFDTSSFVLMRLMEWMPILTNPFNWCPGKALSAFISEIIEMFHEFDQRMLGIIKREFPVMCRRHWTKPSQQQKELSLLFQRSFASKTKVAFRADLIWKEFDIVLIFLDLSITTAWKSATTLLKTPSVQFGEKQAFYTFWKETQRYAKEIHKRRQIESFEMNKMFSAGAVTARYESSYSAMKRTAERVINTERCRRIATIINVWKSQNMFIKHDAIHIYFGANKMDHSIATLMMGLSTKINGIGGGWQRFVVFKDDTGTTGAAQARFKGFRLKRVITADARATALLDRVDPRTFQGQLIFIFCVLLTRVLFALFIGE